MKRISLLLILLTFACKNNNEVRSSRVEQEETKTFESVASEIILEDDSLSIRAIQVMGDNLAFAANHGTYGLYNSQSEKWKISTQNFDTIKPEFRAVASTSNDFFMLSVANPALLYKTGDKGSMELVYKEENENVFYDSMIFWNDLEGIAMGDPIDGCISIITTRNGGNSWNKITCDSLPASLQGEAAFAASNSNIAVLDDNTWILTGGKKSRVLYSPDRGKSWEIYDTPLIQGEETTGGYSIDFYDDRNGVIIGGDYTKPENTSANKAITRDGGKTWQLIAEGQEPGYKSSVRYVPNSGGKAMVATGFTGIHYSKDSGASWKKLSDEGFYTLRFVNDTLAYAAGKGRIARLIFD
ncbi:WD40/YVTN/BNR-like repeat-containing protein [Christiangramia sabulilitoris]|uniref:Oxidoreductase n=1 Tax=Christiangramia sabulilitoris TaxID=2583991 RepID=A0A550I6T6_9FLAO|nr:oxidoreductase [Christiangramia sabulilitoris]TRO66682.1 oxidoreductase [Christiangramia sabulilitoris]